jgi:hypothetical protein
MTGSSRHRSSTAALLDEQRARWSTFFRFRSEFHEPAEALAVDASAGVLRDFRLVTLFDI